MLMPSSTLSMCPLNSDATARWPVEIKNHTVSAARSAARNPSGSFVVQPKSYFGLPLTSAATRIFTLSYEVQAAISVLSPKHSSVPVMHTREGIREDPLCRRSTELPPPGVSQSRNTILDVLTP